MQRILQSFFLLLASATDWQLAKYVEFLKAENRILRDRLPPRLRLTPRERTRLIRLGRPLGAAIREIITIVSPRTFLRWLNGTAGQSRSRKPGRPRTPETVRDIILRIAAETGWGYTRILGELKKLGFASISRSTVRNILTEAGIDPGPKRGEGSWADFLARHASTLWACDFFTSSIWTLTGRIEVSVLFFIHLGSRKVHVTGATANPNRPWMIQQARAISHLWANEPQPAKILFRDYDSKFVREFDAILESNAISVQRLGPRAPNLNAFAERWVQSVRQECLDHFVICGFDHLLYLLNEYLAHYHVERPHQGIGNNLVAALRSENPLPTSSNVRCELRLGGLLRHYRKAS